MICVVCNRDYLDNLELVQGRRVCDTCQDTCVKCGYFPIAEDDRLCSPCRTKLKRDLFGIRYGGHYET